MNRIDYYKKKYSDELFHYGIKRRSGRYPWGSGERPYQSANSSQEKKLVQKGKRSNIYRNERTIPKGTKIYQVDRVGAKIFASNKVEILNPSDSVSYLEPDRNKQKIYDRRFSGKSYEREMVLTGDIKIPSRQHVKDIMDEVIKSNPSFLDDAVYAMVKKDRSTVDGLSLSSEDELQYLTKRYTESIKNQNLDDRFGSLVESFNSDNALKKSIIEKLQSEGYDGMVNEADVGAWRNKAQGADSIILFDLNKSTKEVSKRELSKEEQESASADYYKWASKARRSKVW